MKLMETANILEDILKPEQERSQRTSTLLNIGVQPGGPGDGTTRVYSYRYIGIEDKTEYIKQLLSFRNRLQQSRPTSAGVVEFIDKIEQPYDPRGSEHVGEVLSRIGELDFRNSRGRDLLFSEGLFHFGNPKLMPELRQAYQQVMELYYHNEPLLSMSIEKNFIIKLFLWMKEYIPKLFPEQSTATPSGWVPKGIYYGEIRKHEAYFMILLSLLGCDILMVSAVGEGEYDRVDKAGAYSKSIYLPKRESLRYGEVFASEGRNTMKNPGMGIGIGTVSGSSSGLGKSMRTAIGSDTGSNADRSGARPASATASSTAKTSGSFPARTGTLLQIGREKSAGAEAAEGIASNPGIMKKTAVDIFDDLCFPLEKRVGYVGLPSPILPLYFYRSIGYGGETLTAEDEYYNRVFALDRRLAQLGTGYIRFENMIPAPDNVEVDKVLAKLGSINHFQPGNLPQLLKELSSVGILYHKRDDLLNQYTNRAFSTVLQLYCNREKGLNAGRLQNFVYKLVAWVNRYEPLLLQNRSFKQSGKILYYGDIKHHEVYFLLLMNQIGCDVLYLTTEEQKDRPFLEIDGGEEFTTLLVQEHRAILRDFPAAEKVLRKTTTAYEAERQLENMIYSGEVGLFRPWQLEDYGVQPVTLKATYDEFKLLWKEDSRIRPEFKAENGTAYIPNLFGKISGTKETLADYWEDYRYITQQPNTVVIKSVPFTKVKFTRQEIYLMAFMLDHEKRSINRDALMSSPYYKYSYLRMSLQKLLLNKAEGLMISEGFQRSPDQNFRLLILAVLLNLDERLMKLIETFDYPGAVPKLVIYNNTKDCFSDEDSIVLAFLNSMGFDIAIFTPTNYNTIEQKLKEDQYDRFQLPSLQYELQIPREAERESTKGKSILSRMFGL